MHTNIKIYVDNWLIVIGSEDNNEFENMETRAIQPDALSKLALELLENGRNIFIPTNDVKLFLESCKKIMQYRVACGGLVQNNAKEILFIYRRNKWDLPKGKLDKGETLEECAIREVMEETGAKNIALENLRLETFHIYIEKDKPLLKHTYWYNMQCNDARFEPQAEEQIEEVKWVKANEIEQCLQNSFKSIAEVLAAN